MAIKGKKRSRNRGSQGARRPAAAPRPTLGGSRKGGRWYDSALTMGVVVIFGLVAIGILIALIANLQDRAAETDARRAVLESYVQDVRPTLELASSPASQMSQLTSPPSGDALDTLTEDAEGWVGELQEAQSQLAQIFPEEGVEGVNQLFNEALGLYISSANTFATLPDISEAAVRQEVFIEAATVRDTAHAVFQTAITVLDRLRADADLGSSGLRPPVTPGQIPAPETGGAAEDGANESTVVVPGEDAEAEEDDTGQKGGAEGGDGGG